MCVAWIRTPARPDRRRVEQVPDRARAAPLEAVAHLLHLLGDVDVDRRLGVDRIREADDLAQRLVRDRAQRVRRDAEAQVRVLAETGLS